MAVSFHREQIHFDLKQKIRHRRWIVKCTGMYRKDPGEINFIFTSNAHILRINKQYLNHNHFTDVITFDYSEGNVISGDIFISVDKVRENASFYEVSPEVELRRVMIHGVLHLIGFNDATKDEKTAMEKMENEALNLWSKEK